MELQLKRTHYELFIVPTTVGEYFIIKLQPWIMCRHLVALNNVPWTLNRIFAGDRQKKKIHCCDDQQLCCLVGENYGTELILLHSFELIYCWS